jgi:transposase
VVYRSAREQGADALKHKSPPGSQPKLSPEQMAQLPALLQRGAEAFGFRGQVWTTERVAQMIKQQFGVSYHPAHCSRLLRNLKWSRQKPIEKATQRDEDAIGTWKEDRFDELKKRAEAQGQTMVFVDESAFYLLPMAVLPSAPRGQTPVLQVPLSGFPSFGHRRHHPKGEDLHANARPLVQGARCRPLPPAPLTRD